MAVIHTKRLVLKPLGLEYLKTVHAYTSDMENTKYMMHLPHETIEETMDFLRRIEDEWMRDEPNFYEFAIIYEEQQVGGVSVYLNDDLSGELGWIVNKRYWSQGIAYEAAQALLTYCIETLKLKHFMAHCDGENIASYKIMERLGMSRTGTWKGRKNKGSNEERTEYQYELYI